MDNYFSLSKISFEQFEKENELLKELEELKKSSLGFKLEKFKGKQATKEAIEERKKLSEQNFWNFDKFYFPDIMYEDFAQPNKMLKDIVANATKSGCHIFIGPRKHGKTVTAKKLLIWLLLTGKINTAGIYSETILKSSKILKSIFFILNQNPKILQDYKFEVINANADEFQIKMLDGQEKPIRTCAAFSEGRSLRGYTDLFGRPQFLLGDDVETLESAFSNSAVEHRINKLSEAFHSLNQNGCFIILANDFINTSAIHRLRLQHEQNLLPDDWKVYTYKAWDKNKPLWSQRFKVKSEQALKNILKPLSESDWQANYQNNPIPPDGDFFRREDYKEYFLLPKDARGIIYCDPNLSKKGKGNTTAIVPLLYSPSSDCYFIPEVVCKSFSDSNQLLNALFILKSNHQIVGIAFDGNVSQESTWSQHIKNYCRINQTPFPHIEYKRYKVNDLAKNIQLAFAEGKIKFAEGFSKSKDGEIFLTQLYSFTGTKREGADDDAPDALICAFEFIHERRLVKSVNQPVRGFKDYYQF